MWIPYLMLVLVHQCRGKLDITSCVIELNLGIRRSKLHPTDPNKENKIFLNTVLGTIFEHVKGALFDENAFMRDAFTLAVRTLNHCIYDPEICENMHSCEKDVNCVLFHQVEFRVVMLHVDDDLFNAYQKVGVLAGYSNVPSDKGLSVVIGPHTDLSGKYVQGLLEIHDVPHIVIKRELYHDRTRAINLYPDLDTLSTIYLKMVEKLNWTSFSILYESSKNFIALNNILKMYGPYAHPVYSFYLGIGPNYSEPLLLAKEKNHKSFIVDCSHQNLERILKQLQEVGMMTEAYQYIVTSLDLQTIDLRSYQHSGVNISGVRILNLDDPFVYKILNNNIAQLGISNVHKLLTENALMFDAVALFGQAYKDLSYKYPMEGAKLPIQYTIPHPWSEGLSLRNSILYNSITGLTGPVMLETDGSRRRFKLDILNLHKTGLTKVGTWNPDDGFDHLNLINKIRMKHFNVLITMNPPYAMRVNYSKSLEGNDRYEGFVIDIIKELSAIIGFNYTFYVQEDSNNGMCNKTESGKCVCTGMMEKILSGEMEMAITDLTITEERELCVDFSTAFWNLGMSVLYKKPIKAPPTVFSFLSPFHSHVWLYLAVIYIFISLLFFVIGRISPAEWNNPFPCMEEPSELHNQFTISNSFWFTIGAIMQQGSEIAPVSMSTRTLAGFFWFFCLIIISSYTANLAAFLTIESPVKIVRGIEDLYNQTRIKFGAKKGGSTFMYFQSSKNPKHRSLAQQMQSKEWERWMVTSNEQGIHLARTENYAFLMESSSIEYIQYRMCELEQAGPLIDHKSYAIAYAENFEYHQDISRTISVLQEKLVIKDLYDKWWKEKGAVCFNSESNTGKAMNLDQLAGIYLVLMFGVALSFAMTIWEFCRGIQKLSEKEKADFMKTLSSEVKLITTSRSVKPVIKRTKSTYSNFSDNYSHDFSLTTQT